MQYERGDSMNVKKVLIACILALIFTVSLSACGEETTNSSKEQTNTTVQAVDELQPDQEVTIEEALPTVNATVAVDNLIGSWIDITSPDRFVKITKLDSDYQYEDNEGKYPATFKDGVLKVKVSESDTADAYIDKDTGHLLSVYQDNISEYNKK